MSDRRIAGFTLLEIMLVLSIMAIILVAATRHYTRTQFQRNVLTIDTSVRSLMTAMHNYYYVNCRSLTNHSTTYKIKLSDLTPDYLTNEDLVIDPFNSDKSNYQQAFLWDTDGNGWVIQVDFVFPSSMSNEQRNAYASILDPTFFESGINKGRQMAWRQNAVATSQSSIAGSSPLSDDMEHFSRTQTVRRGFDSHKPSGAEDPCAALR